MLNQLFQESDFILFMQSGLDKRPTQYILSQLDNVLPALPTYYAINPIHPTQNLNDKGAGTPRASINVTAFRNFLFEMDGLSLAQQESLLRHVHNKVPLAQVTFSGANSLHAIISVADTLPFKIHTIEGIEHYSQAWRALDTELRTLAAPHLGDLPTHLFDAQCKDPARLSRTPNAIRPDTGVTQAELEGFGGYVSSDQVLNLMNKYAATNFVTVSDAAPASTSERGYLAARTKNFINNWKPETAHIWPWHPDFIFAVSDLKSQNFTFSEAQTILTSVTGYLDANDLYQMRDIWNRTDFRLNYRPVNK
jgi:hypothetical protein